jgi:hypothetical protein
MPKGQYERQPRFKKVQATAEPELVTRLMPQYKLDAPMPGEVEPEPIHSEPQLPRGWAKGALLNVRNTGAEYRITLHPEEFDPTQPERCLRFTNPAECQNFVSQWYQRTSNDPRAR